MIVFLDSRMVDGTPSFVAAPAGPDTAWPARHAANFQNTEVSAVIKLSNDELKLMQYEHERD